MAKDTDMTSEEAIKKDGFRLMDDFFERVFQTGNSAEHAKSIELTRKAWESILHSMQGAPEFIPPSEFSERPMGQGIWFENIGAGKIPKPVWTNPTKEMFPDYNVKCKPPAEVALEKINNDIRATEQELARNKMIIRGIEGRLDGLTGAKYILEECIRKDKGED